MKIIKAEGYKKPNYAVALAATMVAVTLSGCGSSEVDLAGATTLDTPPEEEVQLAGDVSVANPDEYEVEQDECDVEQDECEVELDGDVAIAPAEQDQMVDYDGGLAFYTDTDD